jgi:DNA integrity scanning protein DisA with diadenylate cyclase activity
MLAFERDGEVDQTEGQRFAEVISSISQFANTDGCVVFDESLQLRSFGSFIRDTRKDIEVADHVLELHDDGSVSGEKSMEDLGTRHKSAALLCARTIGTHAFVVSQDGPIHVFFSAESDELEGRGRKSGFIVGPFDPAVR